MNDAAAHRTFHGQTSFISNVAISDMIPYEQMITQGIKVVDVRGREVPKVRACKAEDGGVHVLALLVGADGPVCSGSPQEVVEFYGFVQGGRIVPR